MKFSLLVLLLLACQPVLAAAAGPSAPPSGVIVAVDPLRPVQDVNADGTTFLQEDAGVPSAGVPSAEPSGAVSAPPSVVPPSPSASPSAIPSTPAPSVDEVFEQGKKAGAAIVSASRTNTLAGWLLAISGGLWFLILLARRWGGLFLSGNSVRIVVVIGGCLAGLISYLADAPTGGEVLLYVLAGPGAIGLNEVIKLFGDPSQKKRAS